MGDNSTPLGVLREVFLTDSRMRRNPGNNSAFQISSAGEAGQGPNSGSWRSGTCPDRTAFGVTYGLVLGSASPTYGEIASGWSKRNAKMTRLSSFGCSN